MTGDLTASVAEFVASRPATKAADVAGELSITEASARVFLGRLADAGTIVRLDRGVYGPAGRGDAATEDQGLSPADSDGEPGRDSASPAVASPSPAADARRNTHPEAPGQEDSTWPALSPVHSPDSATQQESTTVVPSPDATAGHNSRSGASPANIAASAEPAARPVPADATMSILVAEVFLAPSWSCPFCGHRQADGRLPACEDCGWPKDRETPS